MYALIRPARSVRATSPQPFPLDDFPGHAQLPVTGVVEGLRVKFPMDFVVPEGATEVPAPYDIEVLRAYRIGQDKAEAGRLLAATDWYIIRKADTGAEIPAEVQAARDAIRAAQDDREAWVGHADRTVADLVSLAGCPAWP